MKSAPTSDSRTGSGKSARQSEEEEEEAGAPVAAGDDVAAVLVAVEVGRGSASIVCIKMLRGLVMKRPRRLGTPLVHRTGGDRSGLIGTNPDTWWTSKSPRMAAKTAPMSGARRDIAALAPGHNARVTTHEFGLSFSHTDHAGAFDNAFALMPNAEALGCCSGVNNSQAHGEFHRSLLLSLDVES